MHEKGIAHRDLKLENILVYTATSTVSSYEQRYVKIIDFGFSVDVTKPHDASIYCGTPSYMAPEIIKRDNPNPLKTDVWALGILVFYFMCGAFPF